MDVYETKLKVGFNDVDASGRMTPFAAFDRFQEAAETHAELLGIGRQRMVLNNQVWVLSRMSVVFDGRPRFDGTYIVRTLPLGCDRLFFVRDYEIKIDSGETSGGSSGASALSGGSSGAPSGGSIVRARSGWLVIDLETRRPLRPQSLKFSVPKNEGREIMKGSPLALEQRENLIKTGERRAAYSDIDFNSHMNNARYIQWIEDIVDYPLLTGASKIRLDINYLNEIKPGDLIELMSMRIDGADFCPAECGPADSGLADYGLADYCLAIEGKKEGKAAFRAEIKIKNDL